MKNTDKAFIKMAAITLAMAACAVNATALNTNISASQAIVESVETNSEVVVADENMEN